ncbi:MAG: hypothetical protein ACRDSR_04050 [Pseudonocardiaceae bacterium]
MSAPEVPFSELLQRPKDTVARLHASRSRSLRLRRRDAEDLTLTTTAQAEQDSAVVSATTKMFVALMRHDEATRALVIDVMPEAFPWVRFLPIDDVRAFAIELVDTLHATDALQNFAPIIQVITEWRHTAEVHADPELAARIVNVEDDYGAVPEPTIPA